MGQRGASGEVHGDVRRGAGVQPRRPERRRACGIELAKRAAFGRAWGLVYRIGGARVDCSIYSIGDVDVSRVAERYGGGGHRNAAGFSVPMRVWLEEFI